MAILFRIALRNLREHKGKTIIIGTLVALGVFLLVLGNALLATASEGTKRSVIDNYTGHLMVRAISNEPVSITGANSISGDVTGRTIPFYSRVFEIVTSQPEVLVANPQITSFAQIDFSTEFQNRGAIAFLFGIEPDTYQQMFAGNLEILEGRFLEPGERGVVLPIAMVTEIREELGESVELGTELAFRSFGGTGGLSIRRVPVVGVYRFLVDNPALSGFSFMDAQTLRSMNGMVLGASVTQDIRPEDSLLLEIDSDDLFGDSGTDDFFSTFFSFEDVESSDDGFTLDEDSEDLFAFLGDMSERAMLAQPDSGAWSYLLIRLDNPDKAVEVQQRLNRLFDEEGLGAEVVDWAVASGGVASFNQAFQTFFLVVVGLITLVSIIVIMNTLVISVVERTYEIGTMRALGAQKRFVRRMFVLETLGISGVFGLVGLGLGIITVLILNLVGLPAPNNFFEILFGGEILRPVVTFSAFVQGILMILGIGFVSSLYPVAVALKIQPIKAMQSN